MKHFKKLPILLAQVSVAVGMLSMTVLATEGNGDRAAAPNAENVMQNLGNNTSVDSIVNPIKGIFGSVYDVVMAVGVALLVLAVVLVGIGFSTSGGNGGKREESKSQLIYALAAAVGLGAVVSIATAILKIGASI